MLSGSLAGFPHIWYCMHAPEFRQRNTRCRCCPTICSDRYNWSKPAQHGNGRHDEKVVFSFITENLLRIDRGRGTSDHHSKEWNSKHKLGISSSHGSVKGRPFLCTQDCFAYCIRLTKEAEYIFNTRARVATFIYDMPRTYMGEYILHWKRAKTPFRTQITRSTRTPIAATRKDPLEMGDENWWVL